MNNSIRLDTRSHRKKEASARSGHDFLTSRGRVDLRAMLLSVRPLQESFKCHKRVMIMTASLLDQTHTPPFTRKLAEREPLPGVPQSSECGVVTHIAQC
jgi:hypothetical protein